ncbi:Cupredoxin [Favolaschia claudopus]|uniref:Cupredoxin n=1 Tax=Favolaschia claudopus TaxID=2862362 RepID=A0AAV9ZP43_9AGAR
MASTFLLLLLAAFIPGLVCQKTFTVQVGAQGNLAYDPPFIQAAQGDLIRFIFNPKNHSVTQSSFDSPCHPLIGGASSGFHFASNTSGLLDTWQFAVPSAANPFWFFCAQTQPVSHCGKGMVFAINPPAEPDPHSFDAFQRLAMSQASPTLSSFASVSAQPWSTVTATITHDGSTFASAYTSYEGTPAPTYAPGGPVNHVVKVGVDGLSFSPSNISAAISDTVTFEFHPKNHTVTQSSFSHPCEPLEVTSTTGQVGFNSGFQFVSADTGFPTFQITINDTAPIWSYCSQPGPPKHCQSGMVFSINAVETGPNNFAAFKSLAMNGAILAGGASTSSSALSSDPSQSVGGAAHNGRWSVLISLIATAVVVGLS